MRSKNRYVSISSALGCLLFLMIVFGSFSVCFSEETDSSLLNITPAFTDTVEHITIVSIGYVSNGVELTIAYPTFFTNSLDIFSCSNLILQECGLEATVEVNPNSQYIKWVDSKVYTNATVRKYYIVGNTGHDSDGDGLASAREIFLYGTDMNRADTDSDGMPDGWEIRYGFDPLKNDGNFDADGDGLSNVKEYQLGMNPRNADEDSDGLRDGWEVTYFGRIWVEDGEGDPDGDGYLNIYEYVKNSNPISGTNFPAATITVTIDSGMTIQQAIDMCTNDYDIVLVQRGVWTGAGNRNISLRGKKIMVTGWGNYSRAVIDCGLVNGVRGFVFTNNESRVTVVNNLTITGGLVQGTGNGGGICCVGSSPTIINCLIATNTAYQYGGGVYANNSNIRLRNCVLRENYAITGGGNIALFGGGEVMNCTVENNRTNGVYMKTQYGGGVYANGGAFLITNSVIRGNVCDIDGGGLWLLGNKGMVVGCSVVSNRAVGVLGGGGIFAKGGVTVRDSFIGYNRLEGGSFGGGGILLYTDGGVGSVLMGSQAVSNYVSTTGTGGGGVSVYKDGTVNGVATIEGCDIAGNVSATNAGGILVYHNSKASIKRCRITSNSGSNRGGGVAGLIGSVITFENNYVGRNSAMYGGGFYCEATGITVQNSTFYDNSASVRGGGVYKTSGDVGAGAEEVLAGETMLVRNCIAWSNSPSQLDNSSTTEGIRAVYSCVQGGYTNFGSLNIITNNPYLYDGYHTCITNSPCYDAGTEEGMPVVDIDGEVRPEGDKPDIGADELMFIDTDGDGLHDKAELYIYGSLTNSGDLDLDNDHVAEMIERVIGTSTHTWDSDGDGMPDGWELDNGLDPKKKDADGDVDGDGISNYNEMKRQSMRVKVSISDRDLWDDAWNLLLNGAVVASCNGPTVGVAIVYIPYGYDAKFTLQWVKANQQDHTDEYVLKFENMLGANRSIAWEAKEGNSPLEGSLPWNGGNPPDTSSLRWEYYVPVNYSDKQKSPDKTVASSREPLNTISGNMDIEETDIYVPCPTFDLVLRRYYNSREEGTNAVFGDGWRHSFEISLEAVTNAGYRNFAGNWMRMKAGSGEEYWFRAESNGTWVSAIEERMRLEKTAGGYVVIMPDKIYYGFNNEGRIESISNAWGQSLSVVYTGDTGVLSEVQHSNGKRLYFHYDSNGRVIRVDSPSSDLYMRYEYSNLGQLTNAVRHTVRGGESKTRYEYSTVHGKLIRRHNARGDEFGWRYGDVTNGYGVGSLCATGMLLNSYYYAHSVAYSTNIEPSVSVLTYRRGGTNQVYRYVWEKEDCTVQRIEGPNDTNNVVVFKRDGDENVTSAITMEGTNSVEVERQYDSWRNVVSNRTIYNWGVSYWWVYDWDTNDMVVVGITDPDGVRRGFEYTNGLLRLEKEYYGGGGTGGYYQTVYEYTADGLLSSVTDADGRWIRMYYDSYGNVTSVVPMTGHVERYSYSELGYVTNIILPWTNGERVTELEVDEEGKVHRIRYADGGEELYRYDEMGNVTNHIDRGGRETRMKWQPTRRLDEVIRQVGGGWITNRFEYDQQLNTVVVRDSRGRAVESYNLDMQDRVVSVTNLEGQTMEVKYSVGDFVSEVKRFDGSFVRNTYDGMGLLANQRYADDTNRYRYYRNGMISSYENSVCVVSNRYYAGTYRLSEQSVSAGGNEVWSVGYGYTAAGMVSEVLEGGRNWTNRYSYDGGWRLKSIEGRDYAFGYSYYDYNGLVSTITNNRDVIRVEYEHDELDRVKRIEWKRDDGSVLKGFRYRYDIVSMISEISIVSGVQTNIQQYEYDELKRVVRENTLGGIREISYDSEGNRDRVRYNGVDEVYVYVVGNRLDRWGTLGRYSYNPAGCVTNIVRSGGKRYSLRWNGKYQVEEVSDSGGEFERYGYDAIGRRVKTVNAEGEVWHVYDGIHCIADVRSDGRVLRRYIWGRGIDCLLGLIVYDGSGSNELYYAMTDHAGSVHGFVDGGGNIVEEYRYDAFGRVVEVRDGGGALLSRSAIGNRYLWHGREYSWESGLYYFRARWYDPETGRWISNDPIGIAGGLNQYVFCNNNPVNYTDPDGMWTLADDALAFCIGAVGGIVAKGISDLIVGEWSGWEKYMGAALGGGVAGVVSIYHPALAGATYGAVENGYTQWARWMMGKQSTFNTGEFVLEVGIGMGTGFLGSMIKIRGINAGRYSAEARWKRVLKLMDEGKVRRPTGRTVKNGALAQIPDVAVSSCVETAYRLISRSLSEKDKTYFGNK